MLLRLLKQLLHLQSLRCRPDMNLFVFLQTEGLSEVIAELKAKLDVDGDVQVVLDMGQEGETAAMLAWLAAVSCTLCRG